MAVPQRLSYITLGARTMPVLRGFYASLGWRERPGSDDNFATYEAGGVVLALYPLERLAAEAAPTDPLPLPGWNGMTLGINVESAGAVDKAFEIARAAGGRARSPRRLGASGAGTRRTWQTRKEIGGRSPGRPTRSWRPSRSADRRYRDAHL